VPSSTSEGTGSEGTGSSDVLRIATRLSPLALRQAAIVATLLEPVRSEIVPIETAGDRRRDVPIGRIGGQGVFVAEVRQAVLDGRADVAVHSAKDLPATPAPESLGLVIGAVPQREDPRDALAGCGLQQLAAGAVVATGSARRRAQLAWLRPDLGFADLRGNIETRLRRIPAGGAVVVAVAALRRLGIADSLEVELDVLDPVLMLPQVGQGALAVECRAGDVRVLALLAGADHEPSQRALRAERALLAGFGGGCDTPVGGLAIARPDGTLELEGLLASADGHVVLRARRVGGDPEQLGASLAAELLEDRGGRSLLEGGS
jgi:hydroxymethylbilane synthase